MTDELTAALDVIRKRYSMTNYSLATESHHAFSSLVASTSDVPRLLAAVDAVLGQHQAGRIAIQGKLCHRHQEHRHFSITSTEAADIMACRDCTATVYDSCAGCGTSGRLDQCPARSAISHALLGEDRADG